VLAIWSKNVALTIPFVFIALDGLERPARLRSPRFWADWAPFGVVAIACALLSRWVGQSVGMFAKSDTDFLHTLALQGAALWHYALTLVWPTKLAIYYALEPSDGLFGWGLIALIGLALWRLGAPARIGILGVLWFGLTLAPTSTFVHLQNTVADRYPLFPSAGFCLLMGGLVATAIKHRPGLARPTHVVLGVVVTTLAFTAHTRVGAWHSSASLYEAGTTTHPDEARNYIGLAGAQLLEGQASDARAGIDIALARLGRDPRLLQTLGWIQTEQNQPAAAQSSLEEALAANPHLRKAANNLTMLQLIAGDHEAARDTANSLVKTHPLYAQGWTTLGAVALQQRDLAAAERTLQRALMLDPYSATAHCNLGGTYWLQKRSQEAVLQWEACLKGDPQNTQALGGLRAAKRPSRAP
jgi:tetratricopeptide (TPR) repeat protein